MVCEKTLAGRGQVLSAALNRHAEWLLPLLRLVAADVVATTQWLLALAFCSADAADCLGQAGCASYAGDLDALEQACVARKLNLLIAHDRQFSVVLEAPVWATFFISNITTIIVQNLHAQELFPKIHELKRAELKFVRANLARMN
ncbi:hypothetical protein ACIUZH_21430, partial [Pseudomonas aeruginosa]